VSFHHQADPHVRSSLIRRHIDYRVLPLLALLYAIALIDRINLGVARSVGMAKDLKLIKGTRYSTVSCLYFVPYILLQLPSNILLRYFGARNWLTFIVVAWGLVQLAMGYVKSWGYLALCRVLLGVFEAGFFPAIVLIITTWYKRHEVQTRLAAFYMFSLLIGGFSPILAYGLSRLKGKKGISGWAWIFIIEGAITVFCGLVSFFYIADFPEENRFLKPEETAFILKRIEDDRGDSVPDALTWRKIFKHLSDWTMWAYALMFMCATMPAYVIAYFVTIILLGMGWDVPHALLLSAPPYLPAFVTAVAFAWMSDRLKQRAIFIAIQTLITIVGLFLVAYAKQGSVRYFGLFLVNAGALGCIPAILAYAANNITSQSKRSVSSAIIIAWGGVGGIFATTVFREADNPTYIPGIWATLGCQFLMLVLLAITTLRHMYWNKRAREGTLKEPLEGQPGFLYTL